MKIFNKNKKGYVLLDLVMALGIFALLVSVYFGGIRLYAKYTQTVNDNTYKAVSLMECAEVIHSIRYGEIDKMASSGWQSFRGQYPTGLYYLSYDDTNLVWELKPIFKDPITGEQYISFKDMLETSGYNPYTEGEVYEMGVKKHKIRRYVFINNDLATKATVTCYVKYYNPADKKSYIHDWQDFRYYEPLRFTMTDYM